MVELSRWEVFKQDAPGKPHANVGTVHAADARHALITARHVFARRPSAVSLWVVPEAALTTRTAGELAEQPPQRADAGEREVYLAFRKASQKRAMTFTEYVGPVAASSPDDALARAQQAFPQPPALVWTVLPARCLTGSELDEATQQSWFDPAASKTYKQQSSYGVVGKHAGAHKRGQGA